MILKINSLRSTPAHIFVQNMVTSQPALLPLLVKSLIASQLSLRRVNLLTLLFFRKNLSSHA